MWKNSRPDWQGNEASVTKEQLVLRRETRHRYSRRRILATGVLATLGATGMSRSFAAEGYPAKRNLGFQSARELTSEEVASQYNNFYEFGSSKYIQEKAQKLKIDPWKIEFDGAVEKPFSIGFDELMKRVSLEERIYRFRCVEAWAMTVPWSGFPFKDLVELAQPLSSAKYVRLESFYDPAIAMGQKQIWYPWPYVEGITMSEAVNELAFIATGVYGKPLPKQFGAPIRLVLPWKYGFKSIKSIVRVSFSESRPQSFWEKILPAEYGFWANVNPEVPHPRWSQATEKLLGENRSVPTRLFNGYADQVAGLYVDRSGTGLFR